MALAGSPRRPHDAADGLRLPPHSVEAEQAVLGGLMLDATAWDGVADLIEARDFYRRDHQLIFEAIASLVDARSPCDAVTVSEMLSGKGLVDEVGGLAYLARLTRDTPSAANVRAYAGIVRDYGLLRQLVNAGGEIAAMALDTRGRAPGELVEEAERRVFEIAERGTRTRAGFQTVRDILPRTIDRIDLLHQNPGAFTGVATGYTELDKLTVGLQPGDLVIIAGRPSMGKTTLAVNIAENAAIERKVPAAIFSMEMSAEALTMRMISSLGRVSQAHLRTGALSAEDWPRITSATEVLSQAPIYIDETPSLTPTEIRARARRLKREKGLGLIVVDYLQLMQVPGTRENRATEISEISRSLKALAKELQLPVIALSQLNRSVEQRVEKKPVMSDLRECVTGETLVCLTDGRRVPIRDLVGQTPRVWAMDAQQKLVPAQSDLVWSVGVKPICRVSLASGRSIRATAKHRLYTGRGWRTVGELASHDHVATTRRIPAPEAPTLSADPKVVVLAAVQAARSERGPATSPAAGKGDPSRRIRYALAGPGGAMRYASDDQLSDDVRREWSEPDLLWDRVVSVVADGAEEVFDLTVPGPASWLADGIVSHNSGAIEQDADLILLIYREEVYEPNTPRKGIADIIIAKQRNGPTGEVHLTFLGEFTRFENLVAESYGEGVFR